MSTYADIFDLIDTNLASGNKIPASKHREVEHALLDYIQANLSQSGDIKRVKCNITYLNDNFDVNGLGKNLRLGWAICNGNNGTDNLAGRVGVGYGIGYSSLGAIGGSKDSVVVAHAHGLKYGTSSPGTKYPETPYISDVLGGDMQGTETTGVSGTDKNMQPYIINLYIMKL